jgi:uncharacterized delta-60 repeat protein
MGIQRHPAPRPTRAKARLRTLRAPVETLERRVLMAAGFLDPGFDGDGRLIAATGTGGAIAVQADGKVVTAGSTEGPGAPDFLLRRYNADGTPDATFGAGGTVTTAHGLTAAYAVAIGPGGKIVAGGTADTYLGDSALARYNPDGSLDASFGPFPEHGDDLPPPGVVRSAFEGYNEYDEIHDVAVDADGSIVAAGHFSGRGFVVTRFANDGLFYDRFDSVQFPGTVATAGAAATAVSLAPGGQVVAAGYTATAAGQPENFALVRFNGDGVIDQTFGFRGVAVTDFRSAPPGADGPDPLDAATGVALAPGGAVVVAGSSDGRGALARYLATGDPAPAPVNVTAANTLAVNGTAGNDDVRLYPWPDVVPRFVADLNGSLFLSPVGVGRAAVSGLAGDDVIRAVGAPMNFPLELDGAAGHDQLTGGAGDDLLRGGDGGDLLDGGPGRDSLQGGAGADTADYGARTAPLDLSLDGVANDGAAGESDNLGVDVENVRGGAGGDRIVGSSRGNVLHGNGGNDTIDGGLGADAVFGGDGDDLLLATESGGAAASDHYSGGNGADTVDYSGRAGRLVIRLGLYALSGRERDTLRSDIENAVGGAGADRIEGNDRANILLGGAGDDVLVGRGGNDILLGAQGNDVLTDRVGTNTLDGGPGIDTVNGVREPGADVVLEAENAALSGAGVSRTHAGYTGTGYADFGSARGYYIDWAFDNGAGAGPRTLTFRYANGGSASRPLELRVNGQVLRSAMDFPPTGGWSVWRTVSITVSLTAGVNHIRLTSIETRGPNIDSLTIGA